MPLQDDLLELAALDRRAVRAVMESNQKDLAAALHAYQKLRKSIRKHLLDQTYVSIASPEARSLAQKLTTGEGLPTDKILKQLDANKDLLDFSYDELDELGEELFSSWFSHYEYISGLAELRPLVIHGAVSEAVSRLVRQVKDCYAFQQYDAAYGLCRAVIEASVRDICVRRQLFPDLGENVILFEEFKWGELRRKVSSGDLSKRLQHLYADLCAVLHARKTVTKEEAREAFEETLQVVEQLYMTNGRSGPGKLNSTVSD
ncbi:MAG: hypothetical protein EPN36_12545 [Rhodanobacteraceae bacterium]|nr:MAG: hypothetical protein EPN36_12545 [Rhodanobacteraceae bacterium]